MITEGDKGRLIYLEPTDMNNDGANGYVAPLDDYNIYVDLSIVRNDRYACGQGGYEELKVASARESVSFIRGTDGFLTTNFTDVSMSDPQGNTDECLGIKTISIKYTSWQCPRVSIVFVDVRGASLMGKEEAYLNGTSAEPSFFNEMFRFPYPMFKLTVKGFYGKSVTYNLALENSIIQFNADTGNFEVQADFVGYLYGVFVDIPFSMLAIAPYVTYNGENYFKSQVDDGVFCFENNGEMAPMMTFPEMKLKVAQAAANEKFKRNTQSQMNRLNNLKDQRKQLETLVSEYPFREGWTEPEGRDYIFKVTTVRPKKSEVKKLKDGFLEKVKAYDSRFNDNLSSTYSFCEKDIIFFEMDKVRNGNSFIYKSSDGQDYSGYMNLPVISERCGDLQRAGVSKFMVMCIDKGSRDFIEDCRDIKARIDAIDRETDLVNAEYESAANQLITNALGFPPTIRNFYSLLFAHIDTFTKLMYDATSRIKSQIDGVDGNMRNPLRYGLPLSSTDVNLSSGNKLMPPFTAMFEPTGDTGRTLLWPGSLTNGGQLEEVKLVNAFLSAAKKYGKAATSDSETVKTVSTAQFIPLTYYDLLHFDRTMPNPYESVAYTTDGTDVSFHILSLLGNRGFYYLLSNDSTKWREGRSFGVLDAINLYKAMGRDVNGSFLSFYRTYVENPTTGVDKAIALLTSSKDEMNFNGRPVFTVNNNDVRYTWYSKDGETRLPMDSWSLVRLKSEMTTNNIPEERYLNLTDIQSGNTGNFGIIESRSLARDLIDDMTGTDFSEFQDIAVYKERNVLKNFSDNMDLDFGRNPYNSYSFRRYYDSNGKMRMGMASDSLIRNAIRTGDDTGIYLAYPTATRGDVDYPLHTNPLYLIQEENTDKDEMLKARAYLFLYSIPAYGYLEGHRNGVTTIARSGPELRTSLLREGAHYWRVRNIDENNDVNRDGFIHEGMTPATVLGVDIGQTRYTYKVPGRNEIYVPVREYETSRNSAGGILVGEDAVYDTFYEPEGVNVDRKETLIRYFENWAVSDFARIDMLMRTPDVYDMSTARVRKGILTNVGLDYTKGNDMGLSYEVKVQSELQNLLKSLFFGVSYAVDAVDGIDGNSVPLRTFREVLRGFFEELRKLYQDAVNGETPSADENLVENTLDNDDFRLSTYMVLKNLYDKWFCVNPREKWVFRPGREASNREEYDPLGSVYDKFFYVDIFFHDIGDRLPVSVTKVSNLLSDFLPTTDVLTSDKTFSAYRYMTEIAAMCQGQLMTVPIFYGRNGLDRMKQTFLPQQIADSETDTTSFVFLYSYRTAESIGVGNGYRNDGVDFNDRSTCASFLDDDGNFVPAFGVSYAVQNQSYFKSIRLNTEAAPTNEMSILASMNIAAKASENPRETALYGQDIYNIYASNSYECEVEMMGDVQIMPLMYFQLNGVPLWNGAYVIISVEHIIKPGDMRTVFKGVKISRNTYPMADLVYLSMKRGALTSYSSENDAVYERGEIGSGVREERENLLYGADDETAAYNAWNYMFNVLNLSNKSNCARYVYQLAATYAGKRDVVYGDGRGCTRAGGNANQQGYWNSLRNLGYSLIMDKTYDVPSSRMAGEIESLPVKPGDVLAYYATESVNPQDRAHVYGHTQFYVNGDIGWASSIKNNYNGPLGSFVYNSKSGCSRWRVLHFRAPASGSYNA